MTVQSWENLLSNKITAVDRDRITSLQVMTTTYFVPRCFDVH